MKETKYEQMTLYESDCFAEILPVIEEELPKQFSFEVLELLKETNPFVQKYYYAKSEEHYAFYTLYQSKMDILTFGKMRWYMKVSTIGYPCSLSCPGYVTDDLRFLLESTKYIKGAKLVLNVIHPIKRVQGPEKNVGIETKMGFGETLPTCMFHCNYHSVEEYLNALRSPYRRRLKLAIKRCVEAGIQKVYDSEADIYSLYLNTYEKSGFKLERLEREFFDRVEAEKIVYQKEGKNVGFTLLRKEGTHLDFMLCGMDYSYKTADLYYYMLLNIIGYAIANRCETIDFGQTSEQTKLKLGAYLEKRYFYAAHTNPLLNLVARYGKSLLEYKYDFPDYKVYKDNKNESTVI